MVAPNSPPVAVVGEALVDILEDGGSRTAVPGGSAANVALGLARRGIPVRFSTCLARDAYGEQIADFLTAEGVDLDSGSFAAKRTSTALARRNPAGEVSYTFDVDWRLPSLDLAAPIQHLHLGSFPAFASSVDEWGALLENARGGGPTSWDPNVRPALVPDRSQARARLRALAPVCELIKLSDADADFLLPGTPPDEVADVLLADGVRLVVLTLAEHGLLLANVAGRVRVPAAPAVVVDTIGAGDTVMTSLIADLADGRLTLDEADELEAAGRRATAAAAITVSRSGADLPRTAELGL